MELVGRERSFSIPLTEQPYKQTRLSCFFNKGKLFYIEFNIRLFLYLLFTRFNAACAIDLDTIVPVYYAGKLKKAKLVYDAHELFTEVPEVINRPRVKATWEWVEKKYAPKFDLIYTVGPSLASLFGLRLNREVHVIMNTPKSAPISAFASNTIKNYRIVFSFLKVAAFTVWISILADTNSLDIQLHDTIFVISHWLIIIPFAIGLLFYAALYALFIRLSQKSLNPLLSLLHLWLTSAGLWGIFVLTLYSFQADGHANTTFRTLTINSSIINIGIGTLITLLVSQLLFPINILYTLFFKPDLTPQTNNKLQTSNSKLQTQLSTLTTHHSPLTAPTVLYQGALNEGRGLEHLIEAMRYIDAQLLIAGEGDLSNQLRQQVNQAGLQNKVQFLGYVTPKELKEITAKAHVGVNLLENKGLSYYYSLANKFFDYIHAGVPQLCIDFPEYNFINTKYEVALLIENCSVNEIKTALQRLLTDKSFYSHLQKNCGQCRQQLNWENEEVKLLALYEQLLR
ncbi:MAG: glycosyltransferase [Chitinophagales bacterium]